MMSLASVRLPIASLKTWWMQGGLGASIKVPALGWGGEERGSAWGWHRLMGVVKGQVGCGELMGGLGWPLRGWWAVARAVGKGAGQVGLVGGRPQLVADCKYLTPAGLVAVDVPGTSEPGGGPLARQLLSLPVLASTGVPRRSCLPAPNVHSGDVSLWNILRNNIGKDLSKVSMPVQLNEPLNTLQRLCEELEYSALLDAASCSPDPCERLVPALCRDPTPHQGGLPVSRLSPHEYLVSVSWDCTLKWTVWRASYLPPLPGPCTPLQNTVLQPPPP